MKRHKFMSKFFSLKACKIAAECANCEFLITKLQIWTTKTVCGSQVDISSANQFVNHPIPIRTFGLSFADETCQELYSDQIDMVVGTIWPGISIFCLTFNKNCCGFPQTSQKIHSFWVNIWRVSRNLLYFLFYSEWVSRFFDSQSINK